MQRYEKTEPRFESPTKPTPIYNLKKSAGLPSSKSGESSEIPRHASSIDELLNDFRKELESIKSMEIFPGTPSTQKPEVNISPNTSFEKPPERDLNRSFKSNVPPRSQLDEMVNQLEALAPQSESDKPFASFLPHTVADTKKESVISADFLRESEQPVKQKSDSDPLAYLQATTSQQNKPFEATKMSVDRYKDLDTFKTDDSSAIIKQLRIENIQV